MTVGVGVITDGMGVIADGEGAGAGTVAGAGAGAGTVGVGVGVGGRLVTEGTGGFLLPAEDEDEEDDVVVVDAVGALLIPDLMTVVVEEVVMVPFTHCPFCKMSPNLPEQVLQATPPSLKVKAYEAGSHPPTQFAPFATNPLPQLAQTRLGSTPTATYTNENSSITLEAEIVRTKALSMEELKASGLEPVSESRFSP